jgi:exodeoxyribonuclease III
MKIISFNVNGIRARFHQIQAVIDSHQPDIIGIQECKVHDDSFPLSVITEMGYEVNYFGQKGHYGVAMMSKQKPLRSGKGFPNDAEDAQRRFVWGEFVGKDGQKIVVMNGYFPQGESREHPLKFPAKEKFYADLTQFLQEDFDPKSHLIVMGDVNIAPEDIDIGIGEKNAKRWIKTGKATFLPEEIEWYQTLTAWGLHDTYRKIHPEKADKFSWFDYRTRGFQRKDTGDAGLRIDVILATASLNALCTDVGIDYKIRGMEKPSDHCPIWADFDL